MSAIEWHGPKERPPHSNPVLGYVQYNPTGEWVPAVLTTAVFSWDDTRWWWVWSEEETVETDDNLYSVVWWCEVPIPPFE